MAKLTVKGLEKLAQQQHLTLVLNDREGGFTAKYALYCGGEGKYREVLVRANTLEPIKYQIEVRERLNHYQATGKMASCK